MACSFITVGSGQTCKENFSGVGSTIYVFTSDDLKNASVDNKVNTTLDEDDLDPQYDLSSDDKARFTSGSFLGLKATPIKVKAKTGKVTASSTPDGGGFSNVYTGRIANDMNTMAYVARVMNNRNDWGLLVPTGNPKEFYVLYSDTFDIQFQMESDTGDASDSDHGHTITVTMAPMKYALPRWTGELGDEPTGEVITFA